MKKRFFSLFYLLGCLLNLTNSEGSLQKISKDPHHNMTYINPAFTSSDAIIFHIKYFKAVLLCIADQDDEKYSKKLISFAKENQSIKEDFDLRTLDKYAEKEEDKKLIHFCKRLGNGIAVNGGKKWKEQREKIKKKISELNDTKKFKFFKELRYKRRKERL